MVQIRITEDFEEVAEQEEKLSISDMKKKEKFSHLTFHGNPKRLISFIKNELDNNGYQVKYDGLSGLDGGTMNDIKDVSLRVYAEKRSDIKGKIDLRIPRSLIFLTGIGSLLFIFSVLFFKANWSGLGATSMVISLTLMAGGIFLIIKGPKQKMFSYHPSSHILWLVGEGEAFFGTKTQESKSGHDLKSGSVSAIKTSYLTSDMDVYIAASAKSLDTLYREKLLRDKEKPNPSFWDLIKGTKNNIKEISMENEEEYISLPKDKDEHKKHISREMEDISKKMGKFMGID
ncbi:MAG: hypothetical protein ABIC95_05985 [archaeon]